MKNFTFIGMSGAGKSSLSKGVAKYFGCSQLDTDTLIEAHVGMSISTYIASNSDSQFLDIESTLVSQLTVPKPTIIATGGSVVYSESAMAHLKKISHIIYLKDTLENLEQRIKNYHTRGVIGLNHKSLQAIFEERSHLYEQYADTTLVLGFPFNFNKEIKKITNLISKINQKS